MRVHHSVLRTRRAGEQQDGPAGPEDRVVHSHWSLDTALCLVEIKVLLRQLSYAIKTQLKAPKLGRNVASLHREDLL